MDITELRTKIKELPARGPSSGYPRFTWERRQAELLERIMGANDLSRFLTWPMMAEAFFVGDAPWVQFELDALRDDWGRWKKGIEEVDLGRPVRMEAHPSTSGQMVHQAYILKQWEDAAQASIEDIDSVFEFGAGYGSMARLCHQLGFRGVYAIHDLPEFQLLQQYYLSQTGVTNAVFFPKYEHLSQFDLFIAGCSLSEVPFEVRDNVLGTVSARGYVILYQEHYMGRDNHSYFNDFAERRPELKWKNYQVPHWKAHWYLVGT